MRIDLEREMGMLAQPRAPRRAFPWLPVLAGLCVLNLLLAALALVRGRPAAPPAAAPREDWSGLIAAIESQTVARTEPRIEALEFTLRELQAEVTQTKKTMLALQAERKIAERRDRARLERQMVRAQQADVRSIVRTAPTVPPPGAARLTEAELDAFNALIDRDDSGTQVRAFLRGLTNAAQASAYMAQLQDKGDRWLNAALVLIDENDPVFMEYYANALYFYDILRDVANDRALLAYVETKRSQLQLALQRHEMRRMAAETEQRTRENLQNVEQRLDAVDSTVRRVQERLEYR